MTLSLLALHLQATPLTVGILISLLAAVPLLFAVGWGRTIDRIGVRKPLFIGAGAVLAALLLAAAVPRIEVLFIVSAVVGSGFMLVHICVNQVAGLLGTPEQRSRNFSLLALAFFDFGFFFSRLNIHGRGGRRPADGSVHLVAVSKTFGAEDIAPVLDAGQRVFGENRVQEAMGKWPGLRERFPGVELHLIGPLQTNKVREAVALFDVIETLDRESLAVALASRTRQAREDGAPAGAGEHRRGAAEGRDRAARCRRVPRRVPGAVGTAGRRA